MTYGWARDHTLELIDQYSVAGTATPASYNNQADYIIRIPNLLDDAAVIAATGSCKLRAMVTLDSLEHAREGNWIRYTLPDDFWSMAGGGLLYLSDEGAARSGAFRLLPDRRLAVPKGCPGELRLEYFRWPRLLGQDPQDADELDGAVAVQMALPLYAAAHLCLLDNPYAYAALLNEFNGRMAALGELCQAERDVVVDCYGMC